MPKWMASIDKTTPLVAVGLGALLSGLNPKNLLFDIAAGTAIAQADLSTSEALVPFLVFVLVASVSVAVPVVWYLLAQESASKALDSWKTWLTANNALVMAILLLVLGVKFFGQGLGGLVQLRDRIPNEDRCGVRRHGDRVPAGSGHQADRWTRRFADGNIHWSRTRLGQLSAYRDRRGAPPTEETQPWNLRPCW